MAFANNLDVRHGAREGARLVAVNYNPNGTAVPNDQRDDIIAEVCSRMDLAASATNTSVEFTRTGTDVGDAATVSVYTDHDDLTGFVKAFGNIRLKSSVEIRLEQDADWSLTTGVDGDPCP